MSLSIATGSAPHRSQDPSLMGRSTTTEEPSQASSATSIVSDTLPTAMQRFTFRPLRRSSSRIQRWVQDQQKRHSTGESAEADSPSACATPAAASGCHPWLAYPQLTVSRPPEDNVEAVITLDDESFVVVSEAGERLDGGDAPVTEHAEQVVDLSTAPVTPRKNRSGTITFNTPSPLRNFARNLTQSRRISTSTTTTVRDQSPSRASLFQLPSRNSTHSRASSIASSLFTQRPARDASSDFSTLSSSPSTWKSKRSGLLSHLASPSEDTVDDLSRSPRPSTSSSVSRSSETTYTRTSLDSTSTSQYRSVRPRSPSSFFAGSPSLWSLPTDASHMDDPPESEKTIARDAEKSGSVRIPLLLKSNVGSSTSSLLPLQKQKRKRKLVISGIPPGDTRRYEHVRLWCERFGELNQITRMPNGDLHVDFQRSEVADTVCRLHARVHINGVGSVGLSWYAGKRPGQSR